ncbi:phytoene desaturase family protein [Jeotgalibaca sp. A127]|uniref:phytoene desaturase family protein n=1 Tax=Jeotgalibaca sp. A127 TaxID=3457324 RepID=UPI003FD27AA4
MYSEKKKVIVIGAGVAGLSSAVRLQKEGYAVEIYEKESIPGGKMHVIEKDGFKFDLGPTIVMMPELYREVFEFAGKNPDDYIPMKRLDPMYRSYFDKGTESIDISSDLVQLMKTLEARSPQDAAGFLQYLSSIYDRFSVARDYFIQRPFRKKKDFYNPFMLQQALKLKTFDSATDSISKFVKDEKIQQMLTFQTLYIGVSPKNGPSLYTIIPMIELLYGIWYIDGGMHKMAEGMESVFLELGGKIHYNSPVEEIVVEEGRATGIRVNGGEQSADYVVCNADFPYAMKNLVKNEGAKGKYTDEKIDKMKYSCSCFVLYLGMDRKYEELEHVHTFVFSEDLDKNLEQVFSGEFVEDPSIYIVAASKVDPTVAPEGKEGLYVLVPVSDLATADYDWNDEATAKYYRKKALDAVSNLPGMANVENEIISESMITPLDFQDRFNAYNGACFGLQPTLLQSNHFRPQAKAEACENLYFTGSSTHPGAGVPIVLLSGKIAADELMLDDNK